MSHVIFGILPCLNYKSESGCQYGDKCRFPHVEAEEKPSKKSKKDGAKGSVALLKDSTRLVCVSQERKLGSKHAVKFFTGTWHQIKNRERELSKGKNLTSVILPCQNQEKDHMRRPCTKKKLKNADKATFYTPIEARVMPAPTSKSPEEREFVVDSGASVHMMSKKE